MTLAVALKAAGMKGAESCDPRAVKLFFDERRLHEEERRLRPSSENTSGVTPAVQRWVAGDVYAKKPDSESNRCTHDEAEGEDSVS